jgi:ABC-type nitrate/sulfonate/bicarbonate transport system permease component
LTAQPDISPLSWMPLAVMAFGVGDQPVIFLLSVAAVWPLLLNTAAGVAGIDAPMLLLAKSLCANRIEMIVQVILPSVLSHLVTGLRLAVGIAWIVLVPAEMLGVRAGLGYYILDARDRLSYSELMVVILLIGAIGYGLDTVLRFRNPRVRSLEMTLPDSLKLAAAMQAIPSKLPSSVRLLWLPRKSACRISPAPERSRIPDGAAFA